MESLNSPANQIESQPTVLQPEQLAESVATYLNENVENSVLREHQLAVFRDLESFLRNGEHRGYIDLPTGTGKTVLFVELAKALLNTPDGAPTPRILVVTPTMDLVHQTVGRSGEKGFGGFASELSVTPFFGDSKPKDREEFTRSDVGITTYVSFELLKHQQDFIPAREMGALAVQKVFNLQHQKYLSTIDRNRKLGETIHDTQSRIRRNERYAYQKAQRYMDTKFSGTFEGEPMIDAFNVIFLDEAHHALPGSVAAELVQSLPEDTYVIGFTATPDANEVRRLETILPKEIHSMSLSEAINDKLLSPVTPIAIRSGIKIDGTDIYSDSGEYLDDKIGYLAESKKRNGLIIDTARLFADRGIGTIISCIAGGEARQARELAEELVSRGVRAKAVYSGIKANDRAEIYTAFEQGELDVLTFIGVLGEGWDSKRAKAIINARPTRSQIFAKQRIGRVSRPGGLAYTIDIYDEHDKDNPPITAADLLVDNSVTFGQTIGEVDDEEKATIRDVLSEIHTTQNVVMELESRYAMLQRVIADMPRLQNGSTVINGRSYNSVGNIMNSFSGVKDDVVVRAAQLQGVDLKTSEAVKNGVIKTVYERKTAQDVLRGLPIVTLDKYYVDQEQNRWASLDGWAVLFAQRYPGVHAQDIQTALMSVSQEPQWLPTKTVEHSTIHDRRYRVHKFYEVNDETVRAINAALLDMYQSES